MFMTSTRVRRRRRTSARGSRSPMILIDVIHHDVTYLHDILLLVVLAIHSVVNHHTYDLNIVRVVERIKNFQVNQHYYSVSYPSWRKFQPKWYILMSTTSLGFSSNLFMPSTVSSTNNSHVLNVVSLVERIKNFHVNHQHHIISHSILNKYPTEVIPPYVKDPPGLLLLVVLAVHSAVDYLTTSAKSRQVGYPRKGLSMNIKALPYSCLWAW